LPQIGETLCSKESPVALPTIMVEEPTVSMTFKVRATGFTPRAGVCSTCHIIRSSSSSRKLRWLHECVTPAGQHLLFSASTCF
jgi:predicted membrane GTPase involved in stress response